jgi:cytoskeleton protein RodZ
MPPIGETLREARMRQRLDIADVEERTKIRAKYLRALENEEWSLLPGPTFVRTFLRTYAEVVGIDPYPLVEEYRLSEERDDAPELQLAPMPARDRRDSRRGRRPPPRPPRRRGWTVAGAAAVVLIAFLLVLGLLGEDDSGDGAGDEGRQATTQQTDTVATPAERRAQRRAERRRRQRTAAAAGVTVRIVPSEATYVCVDKGAGSAVVFESTLDAPRSFRDGERIRINLGKRSAAITLNGEPVAVTDSAEPLALELTRDGSTEIASTEAPCA